MSRRFPLEGLLRVRRLAEDKAAAGLEVANRESRAAATAVEDATARLATVTFDAQGLSRTSDAAGAGRAWHTAVATRAAAATQIADLTVIAQDAAAQAEQAAQAWGEARMGVAMIEKLSERHDRRVLAEELAEEQLVLDEAALRRSTKEVDYR